MAPADWSDNENDTVVAGYFSMLSDELSGRRYNKVAQNPALCSKWSKSRGAVMLQWSQTT
jgi:hypothetical protein|tara:strand:+ start:1436 stop:1615 length:180 start_codon:yes stop_codon:yes gene_type:complete